MVSLSTSHQATWQVPPLPPPGPEPGALLLSYTPMVGNPNRHACPEPAVSWLNSCFRNSSPPEELSPPRTRSLRRCRCFDGGIGPRRLRPQFRCQVGQASSKGDSELQVSLQSGIRKQLPDRGALLVTGRQAHRRLGMGTQASELSVSISQDLKIADHALPVSEAPLQPPTSSADLGVGIILELRYVGK